MLTDSPQSEAVRRSNKKMEMYQITTALAEPERTPLMTADAIIRFQKKLNTMLPKQPMFARLM